MINQFDGEFKFLLNFYDCPITIGEFEKLVVIYLLHLEC